MSSQKRLGIYNEFEFPLIIIYIEPLTNNSFMTQFSDFHFDETMFPTLEFKIKQLDKDITGNILSLLNFDPCSKQNE